MQTPAANTPGPPGVFSVSTPGALTLVLMA